MTSLTLRPRRTTRTIGIRTAASAVLACSMFASLSLLLVSDGVAKASTPPTPVIIDTDMYSNSDDVGALATAFALQLQGTVNVIAIGVDTRLSRPAVATNSWKCVAAITQFYGFPNVPLGSDMPDNATAVGDPGMIGPCAALASPSTPAPGSAVAVYRRALASQPDGSVAMVGIGYEENLAALLNSPPDSISPLDGHDLIAQKVSSLTLMGGGYPSRTGENNLIGNPTAAEQVASGWPTKLVYSGYEVGDGVFTGHTLTSVHPASSPVRVAYEALVGPNKNNRSYDLTALYHAVRPNDPLLTEVGPGTNAVDANGGNVFSPGAGDTYYLSLSSATALASTLEGLLDVLPTGATQAITFTSSPPGSPSVGGTYAVTATGGGSGNPVTFSIDASSTSGCTVSAGLVSFTAPAGTCVIDANQAAGAGFSAAPQVQQTVTVGTATQAITFTSSPPGSPSVGGTYPVTATGGGSGNPVTFTIDASSTSGCTVSAGLVSFTAPAGTCVIDANQAGGAGFSAAPQVQQTVTVGTASQTITFTSSPPASPKVGGTYAVTATGGGSGNPVTFTIDASSTSGCTVSAGLVSFTAPAGTCVIDANQAGGAGFSAAPQVQQTVTVAKASQSITFTSRPTSPRVGGTYVVSATATSGLGVAVTVDATATSICSIAGSTVRFVGAGTCVLDANQPGNAGYFAAPLVRQSFNVAKGTQSIAFTTTPPSPGRAGGTYAVVATSTSGLIVTLTIDKKSRGVCSLAKGVVTFLASGTCRIDANQAGNANYGAASQVQQYVTIR